MVYPKAYKTGDEVEHQGVYITNSPYKSIALYTNQYEHFIEASVDSELSILDQSITRVNGNLEYGLYDPDSPYNIDPNKTNEEHEGIGSTWLESEFYYVKEIPPNTEGIPNNPLRLEHLRYPLKEKEHFPTLAELQAKSGFVYQHPHYKVETYNQVVNRYEKFYRNYLLEHGVDEALLKDYTEL